MSTDFERLFLGGNGSADEYLDVLATAARHIADSVGSTTRPTTGLSYADLAAVLEELPVCPAEAVGIDTVMKEVRARVLGDLTAVTHPGYVAHLHCPPILPALAAEVMISASNQSMDSFDQSPSATALESHVIDWMLDLVGYGSAGDGVFTSGATQSNLMGLLLARDACAPVATQGLPAGARSWRVLCSPLTHFSVTQALSVLGLGEQAVLEVACGTDGRMDPKALAHRIDDSVQRGEKPIAVVLTAGTTDLGSVDPIHELAAVARQRGLWVHLDAAAAGALLLSDRHRELLRGVEMVDSVAIDLHKLLFQPISCGVFLVRDKASFELMRRHADYLNPLSDEEAGTPNLVRKSLQTTRRFDALKVFMTTRALGRRTLAGLIDATLDAAQAAATQVAAEECLRLVAPAATNTVALRWHGDERLSAEQLDLVNAQIHRELRDAGRALVGRTQCHGVSALKLTFVNPLCTTRDARLLVEDIAACGRVLAARIDPGREKTRVTGTELRIERVRWGDPDFEAAKRHEYEIFGLANGFTTPQDDEAGEMTTYRRWERSSEFYVASLQSGQIIAVIRMLRHDPKLGLDSFSTLHDFGLCSHLDAHWGSYFSNGDPATIAELATQAVLPGHRAAGVIEQLWRRVIDVCAREGVRMWTVALVVPLFRWYHTLLPDALHAIGRMLPDYVGADSIPAMLELDHPSVLDVLEHLDSRRARSLAGVERRSA